MNDLKELLDRIRNFNKARNWGQFHSPKNLSISLLIEAAELAEVFQWLTEEESIHLSGEKKVHAGEEIGDVLMYLINLADKLGLDPVDAAMRKLVLNEKKYPVERAKGRAEKYTEFE